MKIERIKVKDIVVKENMRLHSKDVELVGLMESIKQHGLHQPIGVYQKTGNGYVVVFGHRRLMAIKKLGWATVDAIVVPEDTNVLMVNAIENLQRKDINPIELGRICSALKKSNDMTPKEIAVRMSVAESKVAHAIRVFERMPDKFRDRIVSAYGGQAVRKAGKIPLSIANNILKVADIEGFTKKATEKLMDWAIDTGSLQTKDLQLIGRLYHKYGNDMAKAIKEYENYIGVAPRLIFRKEELEPVLKEYGIRVSEYIRWVLMGKKKGQFSEVF